MRAIRVICFTKINNSLIFTVHKGNFVLRYFIFDFNHYWKNYVRGLFKRFESIYYTESMACVITFNSGNISVNIVRYCVSQSIQYLQCNVHVAMLIPRPDAVQLSSWWAFLFQLLRFDVCNQLQSVRTFSTVVILRFVNETCLFQGFKHVSDCL